MLREIRVPFVYPISPRIRAAFQHPPRDSSCFCLPTNYRYRVGGIEHLTGPFVKYARRDDQSFDVIDWKLSREQTNMRAVSAACMYVFGLRRVVI